MMLIGETRGTENICPSATLSTKNHTRTGPVSAIKAGNETPQNHAVFCQINECDVP
jgi:hypothetical protein